MFFFYVKFALPSVKIFADASVKLKSVREKISKSERKEPNVHVKNLKKISYVKENLIFIREKNKNKMHS